MQLEGRNGRQEKMGARVGGERGTVLDRMAEVLGRREGLLIMEIKARPL